MATKILLIPRRMNPAASGWLCAASRKLCSNVASYVQQLGYPRPGAST
jgi:hypothetical protein